MKKYGAVVITSEYRLSKQAPYPAAARQTDYSGLPPAYTFVGDIEAFYCETLTYIENLKKAVEKFEQQYLFACDYYFAKQNDSNEIEG